MAKRMITLYYDTGLTPGNVVSGINVLEAATSQQLPGVYFTRETLTLANIRLNAAYQDVCRADYCRVTTGNTSEFFWCRPRAISGSVTMLELVLDPVTTMGGANFLKIHGLIVRGHYGIDGYTVTSEPWVPMHPLLGGSTMGVVSGDGAQWRLITTAVALMPLSESDTLNLINVYKSNDATAALEIPKITVNSDATEFQMHLWMSNETRSFHYSNISVYDSENDVTKKGLNVLYSAGQLSLVDSYIIPRGLVTMTGGPTIYTKMAGISGQTAGTALNAGYTGMDPDTREAVYKPRWTKTSRLYNYFVIFSPASGAMSIVEASKMPKDTTNVNVAYWVDPSPGGTVHARFLEITDDSNEFSNVVDGGVWPKNSIVMEGASGYLWAAQSAAQQMASVNLASMKQDYEKRAQLAGNDISRMQIGYDAAFAGVNSAAQAAGGAVAMLNPLTWGQGITQMGSAAVNLAQTAANSELRYAQNDLNRQNIEASNRFAGQGFDLQKKAIDAQYLKATTSAPSIFFPPEHSMALYDNSIYAYQVCLDESDAKALDNFFDKYGYSGISYKLDGQLPKPYSPAALNVHYVEIQDASVTGAVTITGTSAFPYYVRQAASQALSGGVFIWDILPSKA